MNQKSQVIENESRNSSTFWIVVGGIMFFVLLAFGSYLNSAINIGVYIDTTNKQTIEKSMSKEFGSKYSTDYLFETRKIGNELLIVYGNQELQEYRVYRKRKFWKNRYDIVYGSCGSLIDRDSGYIQLGKIYTYFVACNNYEEKAKYYTLTCGNFSIKRDIVKGKKVFDIYINDEIVNSMSVPVVSWYDENGKKL